MSDGAAHDERLILPDALAHELAAQFGTPLYVLSEPHVRSLVRRFRGAVHASWAPSELAYASKANATLAVLAIMASERLLIDVASEGEFRAALLAGAAASRCYFHGSNKQDAELAFAVANGIGHIVADNIEEVGRLEAGGPPVLLRLAPGVDPITHAKISTGQADTKFGFGIADGSALRAFDLARERGLDVAGVHCHVGSQLLDSGAQQDGAEAIAGFAARLWHERGHEIRVLNVGGGYAAWSGRGPQPVGPEVYCEGVAAGVRRAFAGTPLAPTLIHEPGRVLVAHAGVTLYRVGVRKTVTLPGGGARTYVSVDGGLSDNPRPALYGAAYDVRAVGASGALAPVRVAGKHCEVDALFDVDLPAGLRRGDLIQVLSTGAYNASMANNYNLYPRPATVLLRPDGTPTLIQERESWDAMFARERIPSDLE